MRTGIVLAVAICMGLAGAANAALQEGDQILVDLGTCWVGSDGGGNDVFGPTPEDGSAPDGNVWNNYQFGGQALSALNLVDTDGNATGAVWTCTVVWSKCGTGHGGFPQNQAMGDNMYPNSAKTDGRLWTDATGAGVIVLSGLDDSLLYDIRCFGSADTDAAMDAGTFLNGVTNYTIGATTIGLDTTDNNSAVALFSAVATDGSGNISLSISGADSSVDGILSVLDVTVVPEPMTLTLVAVGGLALLKRRRS